MDSNAMEIYPAIDLRAGRVVRLSQGDYGQETRYVASPLELARSYLAAGARWLHVVDLDGARDGTAHDAGENRAWIAQIAQLPELKVQTGGGVRTRADFDALRALGVARVVVGSLFDRDPQEVGRWLVASSTEAVCIALDVREIDGQMRVQTHGWLRDSALLLEPAIELALNLGARHFLVTDISRDGMLSGPNHALYQTLAERYPSAVFQASGGVTTLADVALLARARVHAAVVGKALLEARFTLREALQSAAA